jgi:hypothetical protein
VAVRRAPHDLLGPGRDDLLPAREEGAVEAVVLEHAEVLSFGIDRGILWDVIENKVPELRMCVRFRSGPIQGLRSWTQLDAAF